MIDYMERKKQKRREKEQKALRENLNGLIRAAEDGLSKSEKDLEETKQILTETLENKLEVFCSYARDKFNESLMNHCVNGELVSHLTSTATGQLLCRIQSLEEQTAVLNSLLDQGYIGQDEVSNCEQAIQNALRTDQGLSNIVEVTWNAYKEHLLDHFNETSREAPSGDVILRTGN